MKKQIQSFLTLTALAAIAALFGSGCTTYKQQSQGMTQHWRMGNYTAAAAEFGKKAQDKAKGKDAVIWRLEQGTALRAANQIPESNTAYDAAEEKINQYEEEAKVKIGREAAATMSNQANLPYRGYAYDKIMLNTYKALNYLQLGDLEKARVEFNRVYQRQKDAVEENKKRIEKASEEGEEKDRAAAEKSRNDPKFQGALDENYKAVNEMKAYADYVNPFSVYLDGLFFLTSHADASDLEHANKSLERVKEYAAETKFIQADMALVNDVMAGKEIPPTTYVIFETGQAASRDQIRIDIPIILANVSYVGAAFPKLVFHEDYLSSLSVTANGETQATELVASMDKVIAQDFKNELPIIITKTLISTVTKAAVAYAANEAAGQQSGMAGLFMKIATAATQAAMNIADLRTWTTLPKEFQVCRVATPADRKLSVGAANGQKSEVTIGEGTVNVVWVKSVTASSPMQISQFKLK